MRLVVDMIGHLSSGDIEQLAMQYAQQLPAGFHHSYGRYQHQRMPDWGTQVCHCV